ncbi:MAG: hypothetical protein COB98_01675 [Flavobacteriaceae bacterium]|nr:MAG: hypothetical protein COB98_01675 [Flavobacteriaceae bacterium]
MRKLMLILFVFVSCIYDPPKNMSKIKITNRTNKTFYVYTSCTDSIQKFPCLKYYRKIENQSELEEFIIGAKAKANSIDGYTYLYDYDINSFFKNCKKGKLNIFLIEEHVFLKYSWEEIYLKQRYWRKFSLNKGHFKDKDYILID